MRKKTYFVFMFNVPVILHWSRSKLAKACLLWHSLCLTNLQRTIGPHLYNQYSENQQNLGSSVILILPIVKKRRLRCSVKVRPIKQQIILLCHKVLCLFRTVTFTSEFIAKRQFWALVTSVTTGRTHWYNQLQLHRADVVLSCLRLFNRSQIVSV